MLVLRDLTITYPDFVGRYSLEAARGTLTAVIGPSGGGKSTMLSAIAGFEVVTSGTLTFDGLDLLPLAPAQRPVAMLFQDFNLFPNLTAARNVALGLRPDLRLDAELWTRVEEALESVGLAGLGQRMPAELSGGQRQRVALARAAVMTRPVLLLDEPFGALDPRLRRDMIHLVDVLRRRRGLTVLIALHTPEEIAGIADQVALIDEGRVVAAGAPDSLLHTGGDLSPHVPGQA